ncbi:MAG: terminase family protein [Alphaproteobacteria bacterium]|nr:terminase family protein [Alphaproteobacteria bacterium]
MNEIIFNQPLNKKFPSSRYNPRLPFISLHNRQERFAIVIAHRRAGKTIACINELIHSAVYCAYPQPRFAYIAPFFVQAKDIAWDYLKYYSQDIINVKFYKKDLSIIFDNDAQIKLYGADNPDRLRGIYLDGVIIDEYAQINPRLWSEIIRPTLIDRKGWVIFIGTPMGRNNFYHLYQHAKKDSSWFCSYLPVSLTNIISPSELGVLKKTMRPEHYAQEFECSFDAAIKGSYYGQLIENAEKENRITLVHHDPLLSVHTAWDLGINDSTAIWFYQQIGNEIRLIDYYEAAGFGLDHYVEKLFQKTLYNYGTHFLPHDINVRELGTGKSRLETLKSYGIKIEIIPKLSFEDGINAAKIILPRCWFDDTKCTKGLNALRLYRQQWDDQRQIFYPNPVRDWTTHAADAFRYLALGIKEKKQAFIDDSKPVYHPFLWNNI